MPVEGGPHGQAIYATAVAIEGRALLIVGRSGAGKSRLAVALVRASTPHRRIVLVGDDRVLLLRRGATLEVRPHPAIAGFVERRGLGIVAMDWCERAPVFGVALLSKDAAPRAISTRNLPTIRLVAGDETSRVEAALDWWPSEHRGCATGSETFQS